VNTGIREAAIIWRTGWFVQLAFQCLYWKKSKCTSDVHVHAAKARGVQV